MSIIGSTVSTGRRKSAAYFTDRATTDWIARWLAIPRDDQRAILSAAIAASKAADDLLIARGQPMARCLAGAGLFDAQEVGASE